MIEIEAWVERNEGHHAWVKIQPHTPCGHCDPEQGCKTVALSRLFGGGNALHKVENPLLAQPGERVKVGVDERLLLRTAIWAYGIPVVLLIVGAAIGQVAAPAGQNIATSVLGAVLGAGLGFGFLFYRNQRAGAPGPAIVARLPREGERISCHKL